MRPKSASDPETTSAGIKLFLRGFANNKDGKFPYFQAIEQLMAREHQVLYVNYTDLETYAAIQTDESRKFIINHLAHQLVAKPQKTLELFQKGVLDILKEIHPIDHDFEDIADSIYVRITNMDSVCGIEIPRIRPEHIGRMVSVDGVVNKMEKSRPFAVKAAYVCTDCGKTTMAAKSFVSTHIVPSKCSSCESPSRNLRHDPSQSENISFVRIGLQPLHEKMEVYSATDDIRAWMFGDDMMSKVKPGERVRLVGIVQVKPASDTNKAVNSLGEYYIHVVSVSHLRDEDVHDDDVSEEIVKTAIDPQWEEDGFRKLYNSICPTHYGDEPVKIAMLLQLVGGDTVVLPDGTKLRGELNILLVSSPGAGKSQMFGYQKRVFRQAVYAAGKGASAAGLTVTVIRDEDSIPTILPGAYLLGDIVIVDELDKTRKEDREMLPSIMDDQQTMYLNKYGINKEFQLKVASLHGLNPMGGKWNPEKTFDANVQQAHWILDRYDLKFVLLNDPNEIMDKAKSSHFGKMLMQAVSERKIKAKQAPATTVIKGTWSVPYMKAWAQYCRKTFSPTCSQAMIDKMTAIYLKLRKDKNTQDVSMREIGHIYRLSMWGGAYLFVRILPLFSSTANTRGLFLYFLPNRSSRLV